MRVLWLSNETPDVDGQGGQRRQHFQIESLLTAGHQVTVCTLAGSQSDARITSTVEVLRSRPRLRGRFVNPVDNMRMSALFDRGWDRIVVAHAESWATWRRHLVGSDTPLLVDMHNVLSDWHRAARRLDDAEHWLEVEKDILEYASMVSVCSGKQKSLLASLASTTESAKIAVLPHGISPDEWNRDPLPGVRPVMKLFGNWCWEPNQKGLEWFLSRVWPEVSARAAISCEIAGPTFKLRQPPGVDLLGRVPSVPVFLHDAWIVGVPVMEGVGAPVKYAEALASGVPVIATRDGSPFDDPAAFVVSDDPREWIEGIHEVLALPTDPRTASAGTRTQALRELNWDVVNSPLTEWVGSGRVPNRTRPV